MPVRPVQRTPQALPDHPLDGRPVHTSHDIRFVVEVMIGQNGNRTTAGGGSYVTTAIRHERDALMVTFKGDIDWDSAREFVEIVDAHLDHYFYQRVVVDVSSPGGLIDALEHIVRAFERWRHRGVLVCTRVTSSAASAAAIMVSLGEERIAGPAAGLLFHGARVIDKVVTAETGARLHAELSRTDERMIGYLVDRALRVRGSVLHQAQPSDRGALEHVAAAVTRSPGWSRRPWRVKRLAERVGNALDKAVRDRDRKTLSRAYKALGEVDRHVSAKLARTLKLIDRIDDAGIAPEPRPDEEERLLDDAGDSPRPDPDAQVGLTVAQWRALYPPSGTVPRRVLTRHLLALGETGSGKTVSAVMPLLAALAGEPPKRFGGALVVDPKGDLVSVLKDLGPKRLRHITVETLALNVMVGERWSIDDDLAARRWVSAATRILERVASFLPDSPLKVLGPHKAAGGNMEFFNQEGTTLLRDVLAFVLMVTAENVPSRNEWIREAGEESIEWIEQLRERARAHHDGGRGPNVLAVCAWAISETALVRPISERETRGPTEPGEKIEWLFETLARHAMPEWGMAPGEGRELLQRVSNHWRRTAEIPSQHAGTVSTARNACAEFAAPRVARSVYFGCEPGWRDAGASALDFAPLVSPEGTGRFVLYQPRRDNHDALVAVVLKALFFESVLAEPARVTAGDRMPLVGYIADEFQRFVTSDAVHGEQSFLDTCRSFGAFCVLATQSTRSIAHALSVLGTTGATNETALDVMLTNTATKLFFRTTDVDTGNRVARLCPRQPGFLPVTEVRPLSLMAPGECYASLADGRFERRRLARYVVDEPGGEPAVPHDRDDVVRSGKDRAPDSVSAGPTEFLSKALMIARSIAHAPDGAGTLSGIAEAQADAGDFEGALASARTIKDANTRASALGAIAEAQADAGDFNGALTSARSIEYASPRNRTLGAIAEVQARAGDFEGALANARSIENAYVAANTLDAIAKAHARAGDFERALASARSIDRTITRAGTLGVIGEAHARAGNAQGAADTFTEALASARSIEDPVPRTDWLGRIAKAMARAGDFEGALAIARNIENVGYWDEAEQHMYDYEFRSETLGAIAETQADAGDFEGALASARSIDRTITRAGTLGVIGEAHARAGNALGAADTFTEALAVAQSIEAPPRRANTLGNIARAMARTGDFEGALAVARNVENVSEWDEAEQHMYDYEFRSGTLRVIAETQASAGDFDGALAVARSIDDAFDRVRTLGAIAEAQARVGDPEGGLAIARGIEHVNASDRSSGEVFATQMRDEALQVRDEAFRAIVETQVTAGDFNGALTSARNITVGIAGALGGIALAQARAGDPEGALAVARRIEEGLPRAETLGAIAEAQARAGDPEGALAVARSIEEALPRAETLGAIAEAQARAGDPEGALAVARSIEEGLPRAETLGAIAETQAHAGEFEGALASARTIKVTNRRALALGAIAEAQAHAGDARGAAVTFAEALDVARCVGSTSLRVQTLAPIAEAMARVALSAKPPPVLR